METSWDREAARIGQIPAPRFGSLLREAPRSEWTLLLRARFRFRADEFAEWCLRPVLARTTGWSPLVGFHRAMLEVPERPHDRRHGVAMDLTLAPRGLAKTTTKKIAVLHAALYGYEAGVVVVCAAHHDAVTWCDTIRSWAHEPEVVQLFGPVPVEGTQTDLLIRGMPLWARGWSGSIRGLNRDGIRPTWIILDDIESERNTRTEGSRNDTQASLGSVIVPLGPTQGGHRIDWLATPAHHDAVAARALRQEPGLSSWRVTRWPAVVQWPEHEALWAEAEALYRDLGEGLDPEARWGRVEAFLEAHPEMRDGAVTVDAHRLPIEVCYRRRWDVGELAWAREYEVRPTVPGEGLFEPETWPRFEISGDHLVIGDRRLAWKTLRLTAAWDPSDGGDDGALAVLAREPSGRCYLLESLLLPVKAGEQARLVVEAAGRWGLREVLVEDNRFGSLGREALERQAREQKVRAAFIPLVQTRNKEVRLSELEAPTSAGLLAVRVDAPPAHLRQFADFDPRERDNRDDLIDAVEMAFRRLHEGGASVLGKRAIL